jgi:hypothetical protein
LDDALQTGSPDGAKTSLRRTHVKLSKFVYGNIDPDFVAMVKEAKKRGNYKEIDPNDIWGSLNLK